jgi:PAS domain S-box-containing protein
MPFLNDFIAKRSIRTLTAFLVVCISVPALAVVLILGLHLFRDRQAQVGKQSLELARVSAIKHQDTIRQAQALLETISRVLAEDGWDDRKTREFFQAVVADNPQYAYVTLASPDGFLRVSSASTDTALFFGDREYFKAVLANRRFAVGRSIVSRTTGLPVMPFAAPVARPGGPLEAVLFLGLNLDEYEKFFASLDAAEGSRFLLFDREGIRLFRYPERDISPAGERLAPSSWGVISKTPETEMTFRAIDASGTPITYSFIRVGGGPEKSAELGILAGIPTPGFGDQVWPAIAKALAVLFSIGAAALAIGYFLSRRIVIDGLVSLRDKASEIADSDQFAPLKPAPGCREVLSLAASFNRMIDFLGRDRQLRDEALKYLDEAREEAEARAREAEAGKRILDALMEHIPEGVAIADAKTGAGMYMSRYGQEMIDGSCARHDCILEVAAGERVLLFHKDTGLPAEVQEMPIYRAAMNGERTENEEWIFNCGDGRRPFILCNAGPIRNLDGEIIAGVAVWRDITKLKMAYEAVQERDAHLRALHENSIDAILLTSPDGLVHQANRAAEKMFGRSGEEICGVGRAGLVDLEDPRLPVLLAAREKTGQAFGELRFKRKNGETFEAEVSSSVFASEGQTRASMIIRDISERKKAEAAAREREEQYRAVFECPNSIKLIIDPDTTAIIDANQAAVEFYGYPLERLRGMSHQEINVLPKADLLAKLANISASQYGHHFSRHRLAGGEVRDVEVYVGSTRHRSGKLVIASIHDVTELKRLEQIKEDMERIVRHDLRSPLAGLINIPLMLMKSGNLTQDQRDMLGMVASSGRKMLGQINNSLELHRLESNTYRRNPTLCRPLQVVRADADILAMSQCLPPETIRIAARGLGDRPEEFALKTEAQLLDIVVMNLLTNALQASEPGAPVEVELALDGGALELAFTNSRPVPAEIRERFFEKFVTAGKVGGTGLGTYSASIMTEAMGGTIAMRTSERDGTTVTVRLPLAPRAADASPAGTEAGAAPPAGTASPAP